MSIEYDTTSLSSLFRDQDSRKLALPNFQREFVWSLDDQKQLLASVLAGFPVGSILVLRGSSHDYAARPLGRQIAVEPTAECIYLLDGQQRLTCFYHFFCDPFGEAEDAWTAVVRETYNLVRNRWMVRVVPDSEEDDDPFGFRWLRFPGRVAEPDDIKDFVHPVRINLTNPTRSFANPGWYRERLAEAEETHDETEGLAARMARLDLARHCKEEGVVPLWEIYGGRSASGWSPLHVQTLQLISNKRVEELEAMASKPTDGLVESALAVRPDLLDKAEPSAADLIRAIPAMQQNWVVTVSKYIEGLIQTPIPIITLPGEEVDRSIPIFEVMNRGGTPLTTFDLVVAKMARAPRDGGDPDLGLAQHLVEHAEAFELPVGDALWGSNSATRPESWRANNYNFLLDRSSLSTTYKNAFLNLLSLQVHSQNGSVADLEVDQIRRAAILAVTAHDIARNWERTAQAIASAWAFLSLRCGIRGSADLRNKLILLPIAYVLLTDGAATDVTVLNRLEYWYWASVLGGAYTERQNDNCVADIKALTGWIAEGKANPFSARAGLSLAAPSYSDRAMLLRTTEESSVTTDVGNYLPQYVLSRNPRDFLSGTRLGAWDVSTELELHHVIPLSNATSIGQSSAELRRDRGGAILGSPLNLTYVSKSTNRTIGGRPVGQYIDQLPDLHVLSHFWPVDAASLVKSADERERDFDLRLLEKRYDALHLAILEELDGLASVT